MPFEAGDLISVDQLYRASDEIVDSLIAKMQSLVPDIYTGDDGNVRILFEVLSGIYESIFLSEQLLSEDMFVTTANTVALSRYGDQYGLPLKPGLTAKGNLRFSGAGGIYIPIGASAAHDPGGGLDPLTFVTTLDGLIPNPGIPAAPVAAIGTAGALTGTFEWVITNVTIEGETTQSPDSNALVLTAQRANLTFGLGGPGTTARRLYRAQDGGPYVLVTTISGNATTTYTDNVTTGLGGNPPIASTAYAVTLPAESEEPGAEYNVISGAISDVSDAPDGVTDVTNPQPFLSGTNEEETEDYRQRLLDAIRAPASGSAEDLESWAENVNGVGSATVFPNDNLGVPTNGHTTVRISGPEGTVPDASVISAVLAELQLQNIANITIHVTTFAPLPTNVTVTITPQTGFLITDVSDSVIDAISTYINNLDVGETLRVAGITGAVFGLPGVADVVVNVPASNQTTAATQKRTVGTVTVQ